MQITRLAAFGFAAAFVAGPASVGAATMTMKGTVSDAMCGAKYHVGDAAGCTKECVKKGSDYALVVDGKAYTLKASTAEKGELDKLAGKMAEVSGDVTGTTIMVKSVKMEKAKK